MTPRGKALLFAAVAVALAAAGVLSWPGGPGFRAKTRSPSNDPARAVGAGGASHSVSPRTGFAADSHVAASRSAALRARFEKLARRDNRLALDAALRLKHGDRVLALRALARAWRNDSRPGYREMGRMIFAVVRLARTPHKPGIGISQFGLNGNDTARLFADPALSFTAVRLANRLLSGYDRAIMLGWAASTYAKVDPGAAYAFGSALSGEGYAQFVDQFSHGWARVNPEAAAEWAASITDSGMRSRALANTIGALSARDPNRAAQFINLLADDAARQSAIRALGAAWAREDTAAALEWAGQMPDSATRQQATAAIQSVAPVGVGITLSRSSPTGYPSAGSLVPAGPAARSGSIQSGDQIVAVLNAGSQWVGTRDLSMDQVAAMIRGKAGQPVQLQLLPRGATDPAQARTVTIVRQQLLLKNPQSGG